MSTTILSERPLQTSEGHVDALVPTILEDDGYAEKLIRKFDFVRKATKEDTANWKARLANTSAPGDRPNESHLEELREKARAHDDAVESADKANNIAKQAIASLKSSQAETEKLAKELDALKAKTAKK